MSDIEARLKEVEVRIEGLGSGGEYTSAQQYPPQQNPYGPVNDEIDLIELWNVIWAGKLKIIAITAVFAVVSVIYALSLPNMYKSTLVLAPAQSEGGGLNGLAAQYGGLAAMAGINLGGSDNSDIEQAMALMNSWSFLESFVTKYNIKPQIMAVKGWNKANNQLEYNTYLFDPISNRWVSDEDKSLEPSSFKTFKLFSSLLSTSLDTKSGLLNISIEHYSPYVAKQWAEWLAKDINQYFQSRDIQEATKNISYLKAKISETNLTEMQTVFYGMIEAQTKTLMLAEVSSEYLLKTIVPAMAAEEKSKPKRGLVFVVAVILGVFCSIIYVFIVSCFPKD